MGALKTGGIVAGGAAGGGGTVGLGGYAVHKATVKTVWEQLESEGFSNNSVTNGDWEKIKTRAKSSTPVNPFLTGVSLESGSDEDNNSLKSFCSRQKNENYSSKVFSGNKGFLENVKKFCFLTIKEKLNSSAMNLDGNDDDSKISNLINTLKGYTKSQENASDPDVDGEWKTLKDNANESNKETENKDKLKSLCRGLYFSPFKGESNNDYKLAKKFCVSS